MRPILLVLGWLLGATALYVALVLLELHWNLYEWRPTLDLTTLGLILGMCVILVLIGLLARASFHPAVRGVSFLIALALFALAVYVSPREPLTHGLFARTRTSPLWYRAGRFAILASPTTLWTFGLRRHRKMASQTPPQF